MKKSILATIALIATSNAFAAEYGTGSVNSYFIDTDGTVSFGLTVALPGTCNYFSDQFQFDGSSELGKQRLMTLLAAKATGLTLRVWYTASTAPGTNQSNGCTETTMAKLGAIGLQ